MQRFQIEDLVVQDTSGVVFRAIDTETGLPVAVRRFFPFGPTGGGLNEEEQVDFAAAVTRLAEIRHPALRSVVSGGCDPVDGMPYVATEWIEGTGLQNLLASRPLSQQEAIALLSPALEVCQLLSVAIGREGVWLETDPHTIIISTEGVQRPFTFWISPLKCLGQSGSHRGLEPLAELTESVMGWTGKSASGGLGGWLKWLRAAAQSASLQEARERLATAMGTKPHSPAKPQVRHATRPGFAPGKKKSRSAVPVWLAAISVLALLGGGGWMLIRRNAGLLAKAETPLASGIEIKTVDSTPEPPPAARAVRQASSIEVVAGESRLDRTNRLARELMENARDAGSKADAREVAIKGEIASRGGVFNAEDRELLIAQNSRQLTVEGVIDSIAYSGSKKTMYLIFANNTGNSSFRGAIMTKNAAGDLSESKLGSLIGKKVRLTGIVSVEKPERPVIRIDSRRAIQLAE